MPAEGALAIAGLAKSFNPRRVDELAVFNDFNLTAPAGSFTSIVGSNGSGKTTLLNLICGSLAPDRGRIFLGSRELTGLPEYQRSRFIGRVYQDPAKGTCAELTVLENLALAGNKGRRYGLSASVTEADRRAYRDRLAQLGLGLENKLDVRAGALSGGQRQALALLIVTLAPIQLLILDEHTAALDPHSSTKIMELTDRLIRERKLTALMVTHNLRYAAEYGDRIIMMHDGKAVIDAQGSEKAQYTIDRLLQVFNRISIECGN